MIDDLISKLKQDASNWDNFKDLFLEKEIPAKTTLLKEGEISHNMFFIRGGCLRMWFNNDGKDVTFQFFFEDQAVSSFESFFGKQPSIFNLESIERSRVVVLGREGFDAILKHYPELKDDFHQLLLRRISDYALLFLSRIKDNPRKRYDELLHNHPEIIQRVPQHYIASYLGITPISLSRIRNKK